MSYQSRGGSKRGFQVDIGRDMEKITDLLMEDLEVIDTIQLTEEGLIVFDDWCRIQKVIMKYTDVALQPSLRFVIN